MVIVDSVPIFTKKKHGNENKPMEGPKEDPDDVGQQGDDVGCRADFADRHIHLCYNHFKRRNKRSSRRSLFQN